MAREYDPGDRAVVMKVTKKRFTWYAVCKEDNHTAKGSTEAEAVRHFTYHLIRVHPGRTVKKV